MGWQEDREKRILALASATQVKLLRQRKRLRRAILIVLFIGAAVVGLDRALIKRGPVVPIDFRDRNGTVAEWQRSGFMKSIDLGAVAVHVDESLWLQMDAGEKKAITALLSVYLAEQRNSLVQKVHIEGSLSGRRLAVLDDKGLTIEK